MALDDVTAYLRGSITRASRCLRDAVRDQSGSPRVQAIEHGTAVGKVAGLWTALGVIDSGADLPVIIETLCAHAVHAHRAQELIHAHPGRSGYDGHDQGAYLLANSTWTGQLYGLRAALCLLRGWDPELESDKDGKADTFVVEYWRKVDPDYWAD